MELHDANMATWLMIGLALGLFEWLKPGVFVKALAFVFAISLFESPTSNMTVVLFLTLLFFGPISHYTLRNLKNQKLAARPRIEPTFSQSAY